jgi:hypothetical protein
VLHTVVTSQQHVSAWLSDVTPTCPFEHVQQDYHTSDMGCYCPPVLHDRLCTLHARDTLCVLCCSVPADSEMSRQTDPKSQESKE